MKGSNRIHYSAFSFLQFSYDPQTSRQYFTISAQHVVAYPKSWWSSCVFYTVVHYVNFCDGFRDVLPPITCTIIHEIPISSPVHSVLMLGADIRTPNDG